MGKCFNFQAFVCIWDFAPGELLVKFDTYKAKVESVVFSTCESFLFTLGGQDDDQIVVYDVEKKSPICGKKFPVVILPRVKLRRFLHFNGQEVPFLNYLTVVYNSIYTTGWTCFKQDRFYLWFETFPLFFQGGSSSVAAGTAKTLTAAYNRTQCFLSGGEGHLKTWTLDAVRRILTEQNVNLGKIRRVITCIEVGSSTSNWKYVQWKRKSMSSKI